MDIPAVLQHIRPGSEWVLNGNDYEGLVWLKGDDKPSKEEITEAWPQVRGLLQGKSRNQDIKKQIDILAHQYLISLALGDSKKVTSLSGKIQDLHKSMVL